MTETSTTSTAPPPSFWGQIDHQLTRIRTEVADTFEKVRAILLDPAYTFVNSPESHEYSRKFDDKSAFFAGSGGDAQLLYALEDAGWRIDRYQAEYYYTAKNRTSGETLTYVEGDVYAGDQMIS